MFLINPQLNNNILNNNGYNDLLDKIDCTIANLTQAQYTNDIYGFTDIVDYQLYDILCEYREIFMDKLLGCNCLDDEYFIFIVSRIQKLVC